MTAYIDPALAELVVSAASKARDAYDLLERPGYVSRQDVVLYEENEVGWPSPPARNRANSSIERPLDWGSIVGLTKGSYTKVDVTDVPELQELLDYVLADPKLKIKINGLSTYVTKPKQETDMVAFETLSKVAAVLNRASASGDLSKERIAEAYAEMEPGLLAPSLEGDLMFPIALRRLEATETIEISDDVAIEPLSIETQLARAEKYSSGSDVNPNLVAAATHAIVLRSRSFDNSEGSLVRRITWNLRPPGVSEADLVCEALSIASGLDVGYAQVLLRPHGWADDNHWVMDLPPITRVATVQRYPLGLNNRGWLKEHKPVDAEALAQLPRLFVALKSADRRAQLASRRLAQTSRREQADDVLIDACIGIEALLGEGRDELGHRMGLRAATALSAAGWKPAVAYDVLKRVYDYRSTIVHGDLPKKPTIRIDGEEYSPSGTATYLLKQLLLSRLSSSPPWTPLSLDAELYDALSARSYTRSDAERSESESESGPDPSA